MPQNDVAWLRDQLELLADEARAGSLPTAPDQLHRLLTGITRGVDWRDGTWR